MGKRNTSRKQKSRKLAIWIFVLVLIVVAVFSVFAYNGFSVEKTKNFILSFFSVEEGKNASNSSESNNLLNGEVTQVDELKDLNVHFVNVGQGDCIIIEFPDGKNMIIDAGPSNEAVRSSIDSTIERLGISTFDYLLLTHQDSDHAGSMSYVLENYEVKYIFKPNTLSNYSGQFNGKTVGDLPEGLNTGLSKSEGGFVSETKTYFQFLVRAMEEGCPVETFNKDSDFSNSIEYNGEKYTYTFDFLTPIAPKASIKYSDPNDYSPICILEYCGKKIMLTGDAEKESEKEYNLTYRNEFDIDVLKVSHHGSETSTQTLFLENINPEYAVIMVGEGNSYNHPRQNVLDRLIANGITIYRTDNNGDISLSVNFAGNISFSMATDNETTQADNKIGLFAKTSISIPVLSIDIALIYDKKNFI